jgi:hypothetical protein
MIEHPDLLLNHHATRQITRGGNQAADDGAMEAYWQAIEAGRSKDEAGEIMIKTYQKVLYGKELLCHDSKMRAG